MARLQDNIAKAATVSSLACAYTSALSNPSFLVVDVMCVDTPGTTDLTIADTAGHTWTPVAAQQRTSSPNAQVVMRSWTAPNTGTTTPTVTITGSGSSYFVVIVSEYAGIDAGTPLDGVTPVQVTGTAASASPGSITPNTAGAIVHATMTINNNAASDPSVSPDSPFTQIRESETWNADMVGFASEHTQTSIVTDTPTWTIASGYSAGSWLAQAFVLRTAWDGSLSGKARTASSAKASIYRTGGPAPLEDGSYILLEGGADKLMWENSDTGSVSVAVTAKAPAATSAKATLSVAVAQTGTGKSATSAKGTLSVAVAMTGTAKTATSAKAASTAAHAPTATAAKGTLSVAVAATGKAKTSASAKGTLTFLVASRAPTAAKAAGSLSVAVAQTGTAKTATSAKGTLTVGLALVGTAKTATSAKGTTSGSLALAGSSKTAASAKALLLRGPWPSAVSGRFLVDVHGSPWIATGEAAWSAIGQLSNADILTYLTDRAGRGINAIVVNLLEHFYSAHAPNNIDNVAPFTGTAFQSSLNATYWARATYLVEQAGRLGISCFLVPAYFGHAASEGWWNEMAAASNAQMTTYGQDIGALFKSYPHVVWMLGGDQNPDATRTARQDALRTGLDNAGATQLTTVHTNPDDTSENVYGHPAWLDFGTVYKYGSSTGFSRTAYGASSLPLMFVEGGYEQEGWNNQILRAQMWGTILGGTLAGQIFGINPIWHFESGHELFGYTGTWQSNMASELSTDAGRIAAFWTGYAWSTLAPDTISNFITSGRGSGDTEASAAFSTAIGLVYLPAARSITMDLTKLSATSSVRARWFDPSNASYTSIGTYANTGSHTFTHPGNNSTGDADWVLVLDADPSGIALGGAGKTASSAKGTLTLSVASHAPTATSAHAALALAIPVAAHAPTASSAKGSLVQAVPVAGAAKSASSAKGTLSVAVAQTGAAKTATGAKGTLSVAVAMTGVAATAASAKGTVLIPGVFSAHAPTAAAAKGTLSVAVAQTGLAKSATSAKGTLSLAVAAKAKTAVSAKGTLTLVAAAHAATAVSAKGTLGLAVAGKAPTASSAKGTLSVSTGVDFQGKARTATSASGTLSVAVAMTGAARTATTAKGTAGFPIFITAHAATATKGKGTISVAGLLTSIAPTASSAKGTISVAKALAAKAKTATKGKGLLYVQGAVTTVACQDAFATVTNDSGYGDVIVETAWAEDPCRDC